MRTDIDLRQIRNAVEWLREHFGEDFDELLPDFVEGETDITRIVGRLHEQIARDEEIVTGIKARQATIGERKARIEARITASKATVGKFLRAAMLTKLELPEVTYSVRDGKPGLRVVDPEAVPEAYQRVKAEPDKTKINEAFTDAKSLPNWLVRTVPTDVVTARKN